MLVTEIKKIDDKRYCLYLDYEPYCSLYMSDIKRLDLAEGVDIDEALIAEFRKEYLSKRAVNKAVASLKFSEKSEYDIRLKLKELYYDEEIIDAVISKMKSYGYIDDKRYALGYIRKYISKKGRKSILYELTEKRISPDVIEEIFDEEELPDEKMAVSDMLDRRFSQADIERKREKIIGYFLRKGFPVQTVLSCLKDRSSQ